jgi:hypothetical protein
VSVEIEGPSGVLWSGSTNGPLPLRTARARIATRSARTRISTARSPKAPINSMNRRPLTKPVLNLFRVATDELQLANIRSCCGQRIPPSSAARVKTASSIGSVNRPVKVFCWLT